MKLGTKVLLLVLGVTLGLSALVIWVVTANVTHFESARAGAAISDTIQRYVLSIADLHARVTTHVRLVVEEPDVRSQLQPADEGVETAIVQLREEVIGSNIGRILLEEQDVHVAFYVLVNELGDVLFRVAPEKPELEAHLPADAEAWAYEQVLSDDKPVRQYLLTPEGLFLVLSVPLRMQLDAPPSHVAFVGLRIDDRWVRRQLLRGHDSASSEFPLMAWFVADGHVVASGTTRLDGAVPVISPGWTAAAQAAPLPSQGQAMPPPLRLTLSGEDLLGQAFNLPGINGPAGRAVLAGSLDAALVPLRRLQRQILLITLAACLVAGIAAGSVSRMIARPVQQMVIGTQHIAAGKYDQPVTVQRRDEFGMLARSFNQMALGLKERERLRDEMVRRDRELEVARRIQTGVLPRGQPVVRGYDIASYCNPAEQTGGDIYDVVEPSDDTASDARSITLLLADATGHGIGPALSVTQVRSMLRIGLRMRGELGDVLRQINRQLCADLEGGRFVTAFLGRLDPLAHRLDYYAAGQAPLLHYHASDGAVQWLDATTMPLGISEDPPDDGIQSMQLDRGDVVALLTDGFYEYVGPDGRQFDKERVAQVVAERHCRSAAEVLDALLNAVAQFAAGAPQLDDMTAIIIKRCSSVG